MQQLQYSPGQIVTILLEVMIDGYYFANSLTTPVVTNILSPNLVTQLSDGYDYPQNMSHVATGIYSFNFTLPSGGSTIGTYLVEVQYTDPTDTFVHTKLYQINVTAPYGNYSIGTV